MTPQLTKIAECLSESHAREIKLARCLAESLKRIQSLESASKTKDTKAKATELRFNALMRELSEHYAKRTAENEELIRQLEAKIEVDFPAQLAALKTEFATPAAQAAAPQSFNPRGAYEPGEKYKPFDYVSSNGSSYIALVENPTQPPSKKSKQWMLVAARGAGGGDSGGSATGLGTAASRNVGQAAGNVLELSASNTVTIGDGSSPSGRLSLNGPDGIVFVNNDGGLLTFSDSTGTATLDELARLSQVGDRYLTSSTTSNTVSNGAKTFTVGTGLAYSPTQDITIVFDAAHHMHAAVTSYDSANGELVVDVNSHTGSGTYAVWTVNVGGIGAGAIPSGGTTGQVLAKLSSTNYDDAWVTPTVAVGGVTGLGTGVATALAVNVGTAGAAVVFNGAGGTPSSITLTNATGYPAATTTTAGTVPTIGATGSTVTGAPTRRQLLVAITNQFSYKILGAMYTSAASSGTGTASVSDAYGNIRLTGTTSAGARDIVPTGSPVWGVWNGNFNVVDWGQSLVASGFMDVYHTGTPANDTRIRCGVGKASAAIGQIANRGFMVEIQWNGTNYEVFCGVHNGTTLNLQTTGITFATSRGVIWSLEADGAGNAQWYVSAGGSAAPYNGQARTTITLSQTGAPTGTEAVNRHAFIEINNGAAGGAALTVDFQPISYAFGI
jgi:hypothetical protein